MSPSLITPTPMQKIRENETASEMLEDIETNMHAIKGMMEQEATEPDSLWDKFISLKGAVEELEVALIEAGVGG